MKLILARVLNDNEKLFINIWRKEELLKVTIHELIHFHGLNIYNDNKDVIQHYTSRSTILLQQK